MQCECDPSGSLDWSSTGQLAFEGWASPHGGRSAIWIVNADGSGLRRVTSPPRPLRDEHVRWSPDGRRLAFDRGGDGSAAPRVEVLDVASGVSRTVATEGESPVWSPDGAQLAYVHLNWDGVPASEPSALRIVSDTGAAVASLSLPHERGWLDGLICDRPTTRLPRRGPSP